MVFKVGCNHNQNKIQCNSIRISAITFVGATGLAHAIYAGGGPYVGATGLACVAEEGFQGKKGFAYAGLPDVKGKGLI